VYVDKLLCVLVVPLRNHLYWSFSWVAGKTFCSKFMCSKT